MDNQRRAREEPVALGRTPLLGTGRGWGAGGASGGSLEDSAHEATASVWGSGTDLIRLWTTFCPLTEERKGRVPGTVTGAARPGLLC